MLYINNHNIDPYFNHSLEEYFFKNSNEECFILWRNAPCILIGKNQNAYSEINIDYVKENKLPIVRRISGGGAVFNDLGNINFGFISNNASNTFNDFERFTSPIIKALKKLSIEAELSGRNDLTIDGKKFSGNAQAKFNNRILHHGTLLFSANMNNLSEALNVRPIKFEDKSVKSVFSRVTNISEHLHTQMDVIEFKNYIMDFIMETTEDAVLYFLNDEEINNIRKLSDHKYSTWDWNFGSSPKYNFTNEKKFPGGIVELQLNVIGGYIKDIKIYGDFFGQEDIKVLENAIVGTKHSEHDIRTVLSNFDIGAFLSNISVDNIVELMF